MKCPSRTIESGCPDCEKNKPFLAEVMANVPEESHVILISEEGSQLNKDVF
jgi:hypothetical protein